MDCLKTRVRTSDCDCVLNLAVLFGLGLNCMKSDTLKALSDSGFFQSHFLRFFFNDACYD